MKTAIKSLAALAASLLAFSCAQIYPEIDQALIPQASDLTPVITIDQETNYVTFSINEKGLVPMWVFGDEKVDGKASKYYSYTGNGVTLRIRDAGQHTVALRAYNANGVSQGEKLVTFEMQNTYRDPFDPSPYMSVMANTWEWNSSVAGHFGCGEPGSDGRNWWSCGANEKADFSLYDDRMTFTADGQYTYNPADGLVYVNWGSGYNPGGHEAEIASETDYMAAIEGYTCPYYLEQEWNDQGIEEIYLVLPAGKNLSYIPNPEALKEPRWRFVSTKPGDIKKCLDLIIDNGAIAWRYQFIPEGSAKPDEPVEEDEAYYDITGATNLWRAATITPEYWYSPADWSGGIAADAEITAGNGFRAVIPENVGGSEWMAQNKLKSGISTTPDKLYDFCCTFVSSVDATVTVKLTGNPEEDGDIHSMFYDGSVKLTAFEPFTYKKANITNQSAGTGDLMLIFDFGRCPGSTIEVTDICFQEHQDPKGGGGGTEIWDNSKVTITTWYSPADWSGGLTPDITAIAGGWSVVIPQGIGGSEWMGQTHFTLDAPASASKEYTFKVTLNSSADCVATVKLAWEGNDNDNAFFYDNSVKLSAYEDVVYVKSNIAPNVDYDKIALFIDLGRTPAGATVEIKNISLVELGGEGTDIWDNSKVGITTWYSAADWSGGLTPDITSIAGGWSVVIPQGIGGSEWMGQTHFTLDAPASAAKKYTFKVTLNSSADCVATVKLAWEGNDNDNAFFYDGSVALSAYDDIVYVKEEIAPNVDYDKIALFIDLGRTPAGATVEIKDIHLFEL